MDPEDGAVHDDNDNPPEGGEDAAAAAAPDGIGELLALFGESDDSDESD